MAHQYLNLVQFKTMARIPASWIDEVETRAPGFVDQRLQLNSARLDGRLRKRYGAPYSAAPTSNAPTIVLEWLTALTTADVLIKRGVNPTDEQVREHFADRDRALAESLEAANGNAGLYDLPAVEDGSTGSGITRGGTVAYSEASPYVAFDVQVDIAKVEDDGGTGSLS